VCTFPIRQFQVYKRSLEHLPYVYFWNKNDPWTGPANETSLFLVDQANDLQDTELDQILEIYERSDAIDIDCKLVLAGGYPRMTGTYYEMMSDPSYARVSL
jgi:hypothetical protein